MCTAMGVQMRMWDSWLGGMSKGFPHPQTHGKLGIWECQKAFPILEHVGIWHYQGEGLSSRA